MKKVEKFTETTQGGPMKPEEKCTSTEKPITTQLPSQTENAPEPTPKQK